MKPLPIKPSYEDFGISYDTVLQFNRLQDELIRLKNANNNKNIEFKSHLIVCGLISLSVTIFKGNLSFDIQSLLRFIAICFVVYLLGYFFYPLILGIASLLFDFVLKLLPLTKEAQLTKQIESLKPMLNSYDKAQEHYLWQMENYEKSYPGIKDLGYNRERFIKNLEKDLISKLNVEIDYLENQNKVDWWNKLSPWEFEKEVAEWYRRQGYKAETTPYVGDGGVDILLEKDGETICVQCKHYQGRVGVSIMRDLLGTVTANKASKGILVCLTRPTQGAMEFAQANGIKVVTANTLANSTRYSPNLSREVRYVENEDYIGSKNPYLYIGDIGVIFDLFEYWTEANTYITFLKSKGVNAAYLKVRSFYFVICSHKHVLRSY